jgi:hypothetical protein
MRAIFIISLFFGFLASSWSQNNVATNYVPEKVKTKLNNLYPEANNPKWAKEDGRYQAKFKLDRDRLSILLDSIGNLIESGIETRNLPDKAVEYLSSNYPGEKMIKTEKKIQIKGKITYNVFLKNLRLVFDDSGNLIRKVSQKS